MPLSLLKENSFCFIQLGEKLSAPGEEEAAALLEAVCVLGMCHALCALWWWWVGGFTSHSPFSAHY